MWSSRWILGAGAPRAALVFALGLASAGLACGGGEAGTSGSSGAPGGGDATGGSSAGGDGGSSSATTSSSATSSGGSSAQSSTSSLGQGGSEPPSPCDSIAPGADPVAHATAIQACLDDFGRARLAPGTHVIGKALRLAASSELSGLGSERPTLQLVPGNGSNNMIGLKGDAPEAAPTKVQHLRIDVNGAVDNLANAAVVHFQGNNAHVTDVEIFNGKGPQASFHLAGAYFICSSCKGNVIEDSSIHSLFYGVIFGAKNDASFVNVARRNDIHDNLCDPVTFAGYGRAEGNKIHDNGWDCENGPIPGGGIYLLFNDEGAEMVGNAIWNTCGHGLDIDRSSNLVIEKNTVRDPGYRFGGKHPGCAGAAAFLLDVSHSKIVGNVFENKIATNAGADSNDVYHAKGEPAFADLPAGNKTIVAFTLARRPNTTTDVTRSNSVTGNQFRASCGSGCVGLGLFVSRGTGRDLAGAWSAATTSYFKGNETFGSNVGSVRCGANWYAADTDCPAGSPAPCNDDDHQHDAPKGDWARNDFCDAY